MSLNEAAVLISRQEMFRILSEAAGLTFNSFRTDGKFVSPLLRPSLTDLNSVLPFMLV